MDWRLPKRRLLGLPECRWQPLLREGWASMKIISKGELALKQLRNYKIDLTKIQGDGDFLCPNCGVNISPEDETEKVYSILEPIVRDNILEEVVIQCNCCDCRIQASGFSKLLNLRPRGS
jgi:hypothetical protein